MSINPTQGLKTLMDQNFFWWDAFFRRFGPWRWIDVRCSGLRIKVRVNTKYTQEEIQKSLGAICYAATDVMVKELESHVSFRMGRP